MKKHLFAASLIAIFSIGISNSVVAQTKKEKKAETTFMTTGMYDGSKSEIATKYYQEGADKSINKDFKGAIKLYKKAIKEDPNFVEAYDNAGLCYRRLGDFKNAKKYYKKSIELYPEGNMAHMNLGVVYNIEKNYTAAIAEYKEIQKYSPNDPEGYYGTIQPYLYLNQADKAVESATKALELYQAMNSPHTTEAMYLLGMSYYYNDEDENAKIYLKQAQDAGIKLPADLVTKLGL